MERQIPTGVRAIHNGIGGIFTRAEAQLFNMLLNELRSDEYKEQLRKMLNYYCRHSQPGERNRRRSCRILRLYLDGLSECEIARRLNISQQAVQQSFTRIVSRLKVVALILYSRGA